MTMRFVNLLDVPLTAYASQIHPERFETVSADARVQAMAGRACCMLSSSDLTDLAAESMLKLAAGTRPEPCEQLANGQGC